MILENRGIEKKGGQTQKSATYMKLQELRFDFSQFQRYLRQGSDILRCPSPEISFLGWTEGEMKTRTIMINLNCEIAFSRWLCRCQKLQLENVTREQFARRLQRATFMQRNRFTLMMRMTRTMIMLMMMVMMMMRIMLVMIYIL